MRTVSLAFIAMCVILEPARAAAQTICKLFTVNEATAYVGSPVGEGEGALVPGIVGCSWSDEASGNKMSVGVVPAGNALQHKYWGFENWEGFRAVPAVGARAYVARSPVIDVMGKKYGGEWQAGAIVGSQYVSVSLKSPKAGADAAVALLIDAIRRLN